MALSKDFLWGAASAAAQIEGAWDEDGKCPSIWDEAGARIKNGDTCHTACDHYHRYKEDIALMKELGLNSYRFSVSMCRVMPEEGKINPRGLDFYRKLVRELRDAGIEPLCTLYHWDLPVWAQKQGGWKNKRIVDWYLAYAEAVVDALSDEVRWWMTFNEPQCFIMLGYVAGSHAPFRHDVLSFRSHHIRNFLLAHGKCVKMIRQRARSEPKIGIAMASTTFIPASESPEDLGKAAYYSFGHRIGEGSNSLCMDPIGLGRHLPRLDRGSPVPLLDHPAVLGTVPSPGAGDGERHGGKRYGFPGRRLSRPGARRIPRRVPPGNEAGGGRGDPGPRLSALEHYGQFRMVRGIRPALRPDPRGLRNAEAHDQGLRPALRRDHPRERREPVIPISS